MEGFLEIYIGVLKGWKSRYFQLNGQILTYYNSNSQKELGKIHMSVATIQNTSNSSQFTIKTGSKTLCIRTSNMDIKKKWIDALSISMQVSNLKDQQLQMFTQILKSDQQTENDKAKIHDILSSQKLKLINQAMGQITLKEIRLKEQFQNFLGKASTEQQNDIQKLSKLMQDLRKDIYNCLTGIEEEKTNLTYVSNAFQKKIPDLKLLNSEFIRKQLQAQIADEEQINDGDSSETLFESFSGQSQIEKAQKSFIRNNTQPEHNTEKITEPQKQQMHQYIKQLLENSEVYQKFPLTQQILLRQQIPAFRDPNASMPVWEFFKKFIGKDVTKITMPVYFNMPLSLLQKTVEFVEYLDIFQKANLEKNKSLQCGYILSIFFIVYSNTIGNPKKPFNPLLGETYEYIDDNFGFKLICEQVSHHPPIAAYHGESSFFKIEGFINLKISLSLKGIVAYDLGETIITLKSTNEKFSIKKPKTSVHNMIIGKMYVWIQGEMYCKNLDTNHQAILYVKPKGWTSSSDYEAEGKIINQNNQTTFLLNGKWNEFLEAINTETQEVVKLVEKKEWPDQRAEQYYFSKWMITANNLPYSMASQLPPTDTRFRTDQRAYENGDINLAASEKNRLEEDQRQRRKQRQKDEQKYEPLWFYFQINQDKSVQCKFKNDYWKHKESQQWPEIYNTQNNSGVQRQLKYFDKFQQEYNWEAKLQSMLSQKEFEDSSYTQNNSELASLRDCNPNFLYSQKSSKILHPKEISTNQKKPSYTQIDSDQIRSMNIRMKKKLEFDRLKIENENKSLSSLEIKTKSKSPKTFNYHSKPREELTSFESSIQQKVDEQIQNFQQKNLTEKKGKSLSNKKQKTFQRNFNSHKKVSPFQGKTANTQDAIQQCQSSLQELESSICEQKQQKILNEVKQNFDFLKKNVVNQSQIYSDLSGGQTDKEKKLVIDIYKLCVQNSHEKLNDNNLTQFEQLQKIYYYLLQNPTEFSFKALPKSTNDNQVQTENQIQSTSLEELHKKQSHQQELTINDLKRKLSLTNLQSNDLQNKVTDLEHQVAQQKDKCIEIQQRFQQIQLEKNKLIKLNQELVSQLKQNEEAIKLQNKQYLIREEHFQKQIKTLESEKEELVCEYNKIRSRNEFQDNEKQNNEDDNNSQYDQLSEQIHRSDIQQDIKLNKSENLERNESQVSEDDETQEDMEQIVLQLITANKNLNIQFDNEKRNLQQEINQLKDENNNLKIKLQKSVIDTKVHKIIQKERDEYKEKIEKLQKNQNLNEKSENIYEKENKLLFNEMMDQKNLYEKTLQEKKILSQDLQVLQNENSIMKKLIDNFEKRLDNANQNQNYQEQLKESLLKLQKSLEMNQILKKQLDELQEYEQKFKESKNELEGLKEDLTNRKEIEKILRNEIKELKQKLKNNDQNEDIFSQKDLLSQNQQFNTEEDNQFPFLNFQKDKDYNFSNSEISQEVFRTKNSNLQQIPDQIQISEQEEDNKTSIESQNDHDDDSFQQQLR